ncbi:MAG: hypothetical protein HYX41_07750 [Bdellovibrio sp.]|nr:hypothetical protein [Bdellovibrio sp.]
MRSKVIKPKLKTKHSICLLMILASFTFALPALSDPTPPTSEEKSETTLDFVKRKFRIRHFTEYMTPALAGKGGNTPSSTGGASPETDVPGILGPTYTFNYFFIDYDIGNDWKVVFWQRYFFFFDALEGVTHRFRNPRFAIRKVNPFKVKNLSTSFDLYYQPGVAPEAFGPLSRSQEFGFRHNTSYAFPDSKWSAGLVGELTFAFSDVGATTGANYYGWSTLWANYEVTKLLYTVNALTLNFQHFRDQRGNGNLLSWDLPAPMVQNGIGFNIAPEVNVALLLNTYILDTPTLKNSFFSVWVSLNLL